MTTKTTLSGADALLAAAKAPAGRRWGAIYKSAAFLTIADAAAKGAGAVLALLIARFLGPTLYGQYAAAVALAGLWMIATAIGFEQEFTRRGGIDPQAIPSALALNLHSVALTGLIAVTGTVAVLYLRSGGNVVRDVGLLVAATLMINRFHLPFRHLCLLLGRTHVNALFQTVSTGALVALTVALLLSGAGLKPVVIAQLLVAGLTLVGWFLWLPKGWLAPGAVDRAQWGDFIRRGLPFAVTNILWIAYFNFDTFFLSLLRPDADVGVYAGAYRIIGINYIFGYGVANAFTPLLFGAHQSDPGEYRHLARQLFCTAFLSGAVLTAALYFLSAFLVRLILGDQYAAGADIARVLSGAVFFRFTNFALCEMLTTANRQPTRIYLESGLLLLNVVLNVALIPRWSGLGAAMATLGAEAFLFLGALAACAPLLLGRTAAREGRS